MSMFFNINIIDVITILAMIKEYKNWKPIYDEKIKTINQFYELLEIYYNFINDFNKKIKEIINKENRNKIERFLLDNKKKIFDFNILNIINTKNEILEKLYELGFNIKVLQGEKSILNYTDDELYNFKKCIYYSYFTNLVKNNNYRNNDIYLKNMPNIITYISHSFIINNNKLNPTIIVSY
jgi:hypothetical protein